MSFQSIWDVIISFIWIFPNNFMPIIYDLIWAIVFSILDRLLGSGSLKFRQYANIYYDLAKLDACPRWTETKLNKKKEKTFDQFGMFLYLIVVGIFSFIYHIIGAVINGVLCVFIIPAPFCYPFMKIHYKLAFVELNPFKYDFETRIPFYESEEKTPKTRSKKSSKLQPTNSSACSSAYSSAISSARQSRESTPTPHSKHSKK